MDENNQGEERLIYQCSNSIESTALAAEDYLEDGLIRFVARSEKAVAFHHVSFQDIQSISGNLGKGASFNFFDSQSVVLDDQIMCTTLRIEGSEDIFTIRIENVPGKEVKTGIVVPEGDPAAVVTVRLSPMEVVTLLMAIGNLVLRRYAKERQKKLLDEGKS